MYHCYLHGWSNHMYPCPLCKKSVAINPRVGEIPPRKSACEIRSKGTQTVEVDCDAKDDQCEGVDFTELEECMIKLKGQLSDISTSYNSRLKRTKRARKERERCIEVVDEVIHNYIKTLHQLTTMMGEPLPEEITANLVAAKEEIIRRVKEE